MSEKPQPPVDAQQQQQQLAEAKQKFEAAKAQMDKNAVRARDGWVECIARLPMPKTAAIASRLTWKPIPVRPSSARA
jgi:alkylation response protein AidB-like acyl-CoA dehydrogenase